MSDAFSEAAPPAGLPKERQVLVLDLSKSMLAPLPDPSGSDRQKIEIARAAVYRILQTVSQNATPFGLVAFSDTPRVAIPLGEVHGENVPYVESLVSMLTPTGRSAIWDGLALGADLLREPDGAIRGTIVLVTDGWDNASSRYAPPQAGGGPPARRSDLLAHLATPGSNLILRVIGIGNGAERDKGVDSGRINLFLTMLGTYARGVGVPALTSYQEVTNAVELFEEIVHAFLDVEESSGAVAELSQDEIARHAAQAARALKDSDDHAVVARLGRPEGPPSEDDMPYSETPAIEVDVIRTTNGLLPPYAKDRYGPLGDVVDAYLARDYPGALRHLERAKRLVPGVTFSYWQAKIAFARGDPVEAARSLLQAWEASESIPRATRARVVRRLALLQSQLQRDPETETLVRFLEQTESKLQHQPSEVRSGLMSLFEDLLELRGTYQLTRIGGNDDPAGAARDHEEAVREIFGRVQDARLGNATGDPAIDGALDFIEICLAEMR